MTNPFAAPPRIVVLTGPALSREAGFAPFDGAPLDAVVTREGFARDPERVHEFYNSRRRQLQTAVVPGPGHRGLAALDAAGTGGVLIVTRNIDDLHERAGSRAVIHTHGELLKARCLICGKVSDRFDDIGPATQCPVCGNAGHLRPHVVWVGEEPLGMATVYAALAACGLFAVVGADAEAEPVAGFLADARRAGATTAIFNKAPIGETVGRWVKGVLASEG